MVGSWTFLQSLSRCPEGLAARKDACNCISWRSQKARGIRALNRSMHVSHPDDPMQMTDSDVSLRGTASAACMIDRDRQTSACHLSNSLTSGQRSTPSTHCDREQIDTFDAALWHSPCYINRIIGMGVKDIIKRMEELAANGKEDSSSAAAPADSKSKSMSPRGSASTDAKVDQVPKGTATAAQQAPASSGPALDASAKEDAAKPSSPEKEPAVAVTPHTDPQQASEASQPASGQSTQANGPHASAVSKEPEDPEKKAKKVTDECRPMESSPLTSLAGRQPVFANHSKQAAISTKH